MARANQPSLPFTREDFERTVLERIPSLRPAYEHSRTFGLYELARAAAVELFLQESPGGQADATIRLYLADMGRFGSASFHGDDPTGREA
jgi:hypothetical protein